MEDFVKARKQLDKHFTPVWSDDCCGDSSAEISIFELCHHADTNAYGDRIHKVSPNRLKWWLNNNNNHECPLGQDHHVTLQLVLVKTDWGYPNIRSSISKASLDLIIEEFKVKTVHEYFGMIKDEGFVMPYDLKEFQPFHRYGIKLWNYVVLEASYDYSCGRTQAIVWTHEGGLLDMCCILKAHNGLATHNGFYTAITALRHIERAQEVIIGAQHAKILAMERKTGYDSHTKFIDEEAQGDLRKLSTDITGIKSLLARHEKELRFSMNMLNIIVRYLQDPDISNGQNNKAESKRNQSITSMMQIITILRNRMENLVLDVGENKTRVDAQVTAIFHLITQEDTQLSIALARDSKILAEAAQRDANSMVSLSVVTMVFLPPTTAATIIQMPFFYWNGESSGPVVNNQFWISCVVAVALTVATLVIWWIWSRQQMKVKTKWYNLKSEITDEITNQAIDKNLQGTLGGNTISEIELKALTPQVLNWEDVDDHAAVLTVAEMGSGPENCKANVPVVAAAKEIEVTNTFKARGRGWLTFQKSLSWDGAQQV